MYYFRLNIQALVLFFLPIQAMGQNLVPNPSFEDYNQCPSGNSGIDYSPGYTSFPTVKAWVTPLQQSSPDYFNTCALVSSGVNVPSSSFGYQFPRTGNGFAGINAWQGEYSGSTLISDYREYIQCKLLQPLQAGKKYCVSFYVSPTILTNGAFNYVSIDEVGINFSNQQTTQNTGYTLNLSYNIKGPPGQFLSDTTNWVKITGTYIAVGGEEWLTLGCFKTGTGIPNKTQFYPASPNPAFNKERSYMFVDDVSVYEISNKDTLTTFFDSSFCTWSALPMFLKSTAPDGVYHWSTGEISRDILVSTPGTYKCVSKTDCQIYVDSFIVQFRADSAFKFKEEFINCENQPVEIIPGKKFDVYYWSTGESSPTIVVNTTGKYVLTGTNRCGTQSDTAHVYIQPPAPPPTVSDTFFCQLTHDPQFDVKGEKLKWYPHPDAIYGLPVQPQVITRELFKTTYYVSNTIGKCESPRVAVTADIKYQPRKVLDDKAVMCLNDIKLIGKDVSPEVTYKWATGQSGCCVKPDHEGLHLVAITSPYCGTYIDSIQVVFSVCDTCLIAPNAFSPNNDRNNDIFKPLVICPLSEYRMSIFDRWGRKLFESMNVEEGWNGKGLIDDFAENGVYVYTIEYRSTSTKMTKFLKGNVTLIR